VDSIFSLRCYESVFALCKIQQINDKLFFSVAYLNCTYTAKPKVVTHVGFSILQKQKLSIKLALWRQRVKDMEIALSLGAPDTAQKMAFCRQEQAKAEKALRNLEVGVRLQRVWASGTSKV
jgi:hypothetical protein